MKIKFTVINSLGTFVGDEFIEFDCEESKIIEICKDPANLRFKSGGKTLFFNEELLKRSVIGYEREA